MKINFCGHELFLHATGALYWPEQDMLIVSDLHLEKGSSYALRGFFLPPYDTHETLSRLKSVCLETGCKKLLLLGDSFHDTKGYDRLNLTDKNILEDLSALNPIWIQGNHDTGLAPPGFKAIDEWKSQGLIFRHIATKDGQGEISGHYHPKINIKFPGGKISTPCFVRDNSRIIMPAFGAYTGGLSVENGTFQSLLTDPIFYALSQNRVVALKFGTI